MSERAQEDLYFYKLYRGIQVEVRDPMVNDSYTHPQEDAPGGKLFEILNDQLQPDLSWHIDVCY